MLIKEAPDGFSHDLCTDIPKQSKLGNESQTVGCTFVKLRASIHQEDAVLLVKGIQIINLRRSDDRLRFMMGIHIPIRRRLLSE